MPLRFRTDQLENGDVEQVSIVPDYFSEIRNVIVPFRSGIILGAIQRTSAPEGGGEVNQKLAQADVGGDGKMRTSATSNSISNVNRKVLMFI